MRKVSSIWCIVSIFISCSNDSNGNNPYEITGQFTHKNLDCNTDNSEINCIEFVRFIDSTNVDVLMGGGDIVFSTSYAREKNKIKFNQVQGLNFSISFTILNELTLERIEDNEIWLKAE